MTGAAAKDNPVYATASEVNILCDLAKRLATLAKAETRKTSMMSSAQYSYLMRAVSDAVLTLSQL